MRNSELVKNFHMIFQRPIASTPSMIPRAARNLRSDLIAEELEELEDAFDKGDLLATADAIGDLLYVVYGTAVELGIDADAVVQAIHASNMTKLGDDGKAILRDDGKVEKGPNYVAPNLRPILGL